MYSTGMKQQYLLILLSFVAIAAIAGSSSGKDIGNAEKQIVEVDTVRRLPHFIPRLPVFRRFPVIPRVSVRAVHVDVDELDFLPNTVIRSLPKVNPSQAGTVRNRIVKKKTRTGKARIFKKKFSLMKKIAPKPTYYVRAHGILVGNDDGSGGASESNAVDATWLGKMLDKANAIYKSTGIQFLYDPNKDFERIDSTLLNLDYIVPSGLDYDKPKSDPPLSDQELKDLKKAHSDERYHVARLHRHKMVLFFHDGNNIRWDEDLGKWVYHEPRTFAFSGSNLEYVSLPARKGNLQGFAQLTAHETGHYYHLGHPFRVVAKTLEEGKTILRDAVLSGKYTLENALQVFDGDKLSDTPPDASHRIFDAVYGKSGCGKEGKIDIKVTFPRRPRVISRMISKLYILQPDRGNIMSYFKHCTNIPMHFSPKQANIMRKALEEGNRRHLILPPMRLHSLETQMVGGNKRYTAVFKPSKKSEKQVYGWLKGDLIAKYKKDLPTGWRLHLLNSYVQNGVVRYNAVWRRSTSGEEKVYGRPYAQMRAKYDKDRTEGRRLFILNSYVVNGNKVRYNAVWRPGRQSEIQVYGWPYTKMRAKYDELWEEGWRLFILNSYVVNGNKVRYNAVWRPGRQSEIQVYGWKYSDMRAKYDKLWPKGWRLYILNSYVLYGKYQRFNAVWRKVGGTEIQIYSSSYKDYRSLYDDLW